MYFPFAWAEENSYDDSVDGTDDDCGSSKHALRRAKERVTARGAESMTSDGNSVTGPHQESKPTLPKAPAEVRAAEKLREMAFFATKSKEPSDYWKRFED